MAEFLSHQQRCGTPNGYATTMLRVKKVAARSARLNHADVRCHRIATNGETVTTYPLSEPATIYAADGNGEASLDVVGRGTLADCADIVADMGSDRQKPVCIEMDDLDLRFSPEDVAELLRFLREESAGLSNNEITEIKDPDS